MTAPQHTPGPWTATEEDSDGHFVIEAGEGHTCVAYTAGWYRDDGRNDSPANARLIAAAPDLLEAAHRVARAQAGDSFVDPETGDTLAEAVDALRAAIAKAEGRTE